MAIWGRAAGPLDKTVAEVLKKPVCGIVMPISAIDNCNESHWAEVLEILTDAIERAGFVGNVVSNADDVGIIHKRIIQNLYDNPVVVCDVSGKNPNVMFELGLRLAFDKPTIIVKDEKTPFSFDTAAIEHLEYPRDLRFARIVEFKQKLSEKIAATHEKATSDPSYTTFLKHFGEFTVAKLDKKEVSGQEYILEELRNLRLAINRLEGVRGPSIPRSVREVPDYVVYLSESERHKKEEIAKALAASSLVDLVSVREENPNGLSLRIYFKPGADPSEATDMTRKLLSRDTDIK
jgi:hypothetical protein